MKNGIVTLGFLAILMSAIGSAEGEDSVFPPGDAGRGESLFTDRLCFRCHTVHHTKLPEFDIPAKLKLHLGGGDYQSWNRDAYAKAIMNPEHFIAPQYQALMKQAGDPSGANETPMPNLNRVLSVADLIDLAAFLESKSR